jgi:hypothetical protein
MVLAGACHGTNRRRRACQRFMGTPMQGRTSGKPLFVHQGGADLVGAGASNDDEVHAGRKEIGPRSETLSADALDAIAPDGRAHFAADDEAHSGRSRPAPGGLSGHEECKVRRNDSPPGALRVDELDVAAQTAVLPEGEAGRRACRARRHARHRSAGRRYFL